MYRVEFYIKAGMGQPGRWRVTQPVASLADAERDAAQLRRSGIKRTRIVRA